jgi:hypothetical protein
MDAAELAKMARRNGLYVLHDTRTPDATIAVIVMGATGTAPGRIFNMHIGYELTREPEGWQEQETTTLVAGPYTREICEAMKVWQKEAELIEGEMEFYKYIVTRFRPLLITCRDVMLAAGEQENAMIAQELMDELAVMDKAEAAHNLIVEGANKE